MILGTLEVLRVLAVTLWVTICHSWSRGGDRDARRGVYVFALVRALGPMYTKLAQILAAQSGYVSDRFREELRGVYDRNDVAPFPVVRRRLEAAYGRSLDDIFESFETVPVGSGSVAQVHRATLRGGSTVAVKLIKPKASERLRASLSAAAILIQLADRLVLSLRPLRLAENFADVRDALLRQTDLGAEQRDQAAIGERFIGHPFVTVPRLHRKVCTDGVIVMDFLDGIPIYEGTQLHGDRRRLAERMQDAFYTMVYLHGEFHVDPHPGNMLLLPDGRLGLLDFGMVAQIGEAEKWRLAGFYYACVRGEWSLAMKRFTELFVERGEELGDDLEYAHALEAILQSHFRDRTERWSTVGFVGDAAELLRKRGARMKAGMALLILCLATGEGVLADVDPEIDIWRNARAFVDKTSPYVSEAVKQRFDEVFIAQRQASNSLVSAADQVLVAPVHLHRFFLPSEYPLVIARAEGPSLEDVDGFRYVDLSGGYGPHILGYSHPVVQAAIAKASGSLFVNALTTHHEAELAQLIVEALPSADKVIFANSGSEAVTMALRLCRAYTGRQKVAKFEGHYHGQSDQGMVSSWFRFEGVEHAPEPISGCRGALESVIDNTLVLPFCNRDALSRLAEEAHDLACVICEPMPAASCEVDIDYLRRLREICTAANVPLVFDEVVTGFRVDYGGVQTLAGVTPDLTCLGKIIGGGLPCGAVAGHRNLIDVARTTRDPFSDLEIKTFVGGTFSGNALTCAAGAAVLRHLRDNSDSYVQLAKNTAWLKSELTDIAHRHGIAMQVAALTGIMSLEFSSTPLRTIRQKISSSNFRANLTLAYFMRERGIYVPELHTLMISMAHGQKELDAIAEAFDSSLAAMRRDGVLDHEHGLPRLARLAASREEPVHGFGA